MEWFIFISVVAIALYFYKKSSSDVDLKRIRAFTYLLEIFGAKLKGENPHQLNAIIEITTALRVGIHALENEQTFMLDDEVIEAFRHIAENDAILNLLKTSPTKTREFRAAFINCHSRLKLLHNKTHALSPNPNPKDESDRQIRKNYPDDAIFLNHKPNYCPDCGSEKIASILYGYPSDDPKLHADIDEGKIVLGGCCITGSEAEWQCFKCETRMFRDYTI